jgi:hypothetical protein
MEADLREDCGTQEQAADAQAGEPTLEKDTLVIELNTLCDCEKKRASERVQRESQK